MRGAGFGPSVPIVRCVMMQDAKYILICDWCPWLMLFQGYYQLYPNLWWFA